MVFFFFFWSSFDYQCNNKLDNCHKSFKKNSGLKKGLRTRIFARLQDATACPLDAMKGCGEAARGLRGGQTKKGATPTTRPRKKTVGARLMGHGRARERAFFASKEAAT